MHSAIYRIHSSCNLHSILQTFYPLRCVYELRRPIAHRGSSSIRFTQHHEIREITRSISLATGEQVQLQMSHVFSCIVLIVLLTSLSSSCTFSIAHRTNSYVSPRWGCMEYMNKEQRTGTKCITSTAASPSCLLILISDERETINAAAKHVNTSQSDR